MNKITMRIIRKNLIRLTIKTGGEKKHEYYEGPYRVTPIFADQVLETAQKLMLDDVTVLEIPVAKTTNIGGGYTVTIGG